MDVQSSIQPKKGTQEKRGSEYRLRQEVMNQQTQGKEIRFKKTHRPGGSKKKAA